MFARAVTMKLKKDPDTELRRVLEDKIVPLLRKQQGFRDEIALIAPDRLEALAISLWETKEDAEAYHRAGYAEVVKALSGVIVGTPKVQTFDVASSTLHKLAAKTA